MFLYNVTVKVAHPISSQWLEWIKNEHVPEVLATGCFINANILRILDIDDSEGPSYAIQYFAENRAAYDRYIELYANDMRQKSFNKWGDQFIAFRSIMEAVN
jgi:hypothetical protein